MRLSETQKDYVRNAEPNAKLLRFGTLYGIVWHVPEHAPGRRWCGRLVKDVRKPSDAECVRFINAGCALDNMDWLIEWTGETVTAKTRRGVVEQLSAEALR